MKQQVRSSNETLQKILRVTKWIMGSIIVVACGFSTYFQLKTTLSLASNGKDGHTVSRQIRDFTVSIEVILTTIDIGAIVFFFYCIIFIWIYLNKQKLVRPSDKGMAIIGAIFVSYIIVLILNII